MAPDLPVNGALGPYRVVDRLGAGGMGTVYRVVHRPTGRVAAAKLLHGAAAPHALERLRNEARILQALTHPAIARLHEVLEVDGVPCLVMDYVDGETLEQLIRRCGPLPLADAVRLFAELVDTVGYVHQRGVVHRDLKANNVKVDELGAVKLLDFGIAVGSGTPRLTSTGNVVGTLLALAPEQLETGRAEPRSDLWALGVLLYEMLTARLPFEAAGEGFVAMRILRGEYPAASTLRPGLPRAVDRIIGRCLRVRPQERYASAEALLTDVRALQAAEAVASAPRAASPSGPWVPRVLDGVRARDLLRTSGEMATVVVRQWRLTLSVTGAAAAMAFLVWSLQPPLPPMPGPGPGGPGARPDPAWNGSDPFSGARPDPMSLRRLVIRVLEGTADVYLNDVRVGSTPYLLSAPVGTEVQLRLRRAGCDDLRRPLRLEEGMDEVVESLTGCRRP